MKVKIISRTEVIRKVEYYECISDDVLEVPTVLGQNPTDDQIIDALDVQIGDLEYEFKHDKEHPMEVRFVIERINEPQDEYPD